MEKALLLGDLSSVVWFIEHHGKHRTARGKVIVRLGQVWTLTQSSEAVTASLLHANMGMPISCST